MSEWVRKEGYETCLQASEHTMNAAGVEVHMIRFLDGKFCHYHKHTTEYFYFVTGTGRVILDGKEKRLYPGASLVIQPNIIHTFINDSLDTCLEAVMVKTNTGMEDTYRVKI